MRGRKRNQESRGVEIRAKLAEWKQMPESTRPSLRALAHELGVSHQLLSHYSKTSDRWESKEYGRRADAIRARALAEDRPTTAWEEQQIHVYTKAQVRAFAAFALSREIERIKRETKVGPFTSWHIKKLRVIARTGIPEAQELLQKALTGWDEKRDADNWPLIGPGDRKSFRR